MTRTSRSRVEAVGAGREVLCLTNVEPRAPAASPMSPDPVQPRITWALPPSLSFIVTIHQVSATKNPRSVDNVLPDFAGICTSRYGKSPELPEPQYVFAGEMV